MKTEGTKHEGALTIASFQPPPGNGWHVASPYVKPVTPQAASRHLHLLLTACQAAFSTPLPSRRLPISFSNRRGILCFVLFIITKPFWASIALLQFAPKIWLSSNSLLEPCRITLPSAFFTRFLVTPQPQISQYGQEDLGDRPRGTD